MKMEKEVELKDVIWWILDALWAARIDAGGDRGRRLTVALDMAPGTVTVEVVTWNRRERPPEERREYARRTTDGVLVVWNTEPPGVSSGSEWLPEDFKSWIRR
jgi:hypothetical protein